jgi:hypothetical protein
MSNGQSLSIGPDSLQTELISSQVDTNSQQACHK